MNRVMTARIRAAIIYRSIIDGLMTHNGIPIFQEDIDRMERIGQRVIIQYVADWGSQGDNLCTPCDCNA